MKRKIVSKFTLQSLNLLYHLICLSGLIWQITQISVNFFKFDVIKDMNVLMPEERNLKKLLLNICFENYEIRNEYQALVSPGKFDSAKNFTDSLTIEDRFDTVENIPFTIADGRNEINSTEFIIGSKYCFQAVDFPTYDSDIELRRYLFHNIKSIDLNCGEKLPKFDFQRLIGVTELGDKTATTSLYISSFMYYLRRLPWPYMEKCISYGTKDRMQVIADCVNDELIRNGNSFYPMKIFERNGKVPMKDTIETGPIKEYEKKCEKLYPNLDCKQRIYLTNVAPPKISTPISFTPFVNTPKLIFSKASDTDLSFIIKSKARIDDIDYVTYILGALGAWIGFSFISINPFPYLIKVRDPKITIERNTECTLDPVFRRSTHFTKNMVISLARQNLEARKERNRFKNELSDVKGELINISTAMSKILEENRQIKMFITHLK